MPRDVLIVPRKVSLVPVFDCPPDDASPTVVASSPSAASSHLVAPEASMHENSRFTRPLLVVAVLATFLLAARLYADEVEGISGIMWTTGPTVAALGDQAEITLPEGFVFTGPKGTKTFMELNHNPVDGDELGIVMPMDTTSSWFAIYVFDESGYVKDDE